MGDRMLMSGNGRHRRPRQAPTAVVVVAATGAGIALPLFGAGAAQAADASTWDKVAACESGGMWSANAGNGFFGGLAITEDTWEQYGGTAYAERPDLASRSQQIAVAETLLAELGPDAWPGCAGPAGLVAGGAPPKVDPGSILTPAPSTTPTTPAKPTTPPAATKPKTTPSTTPGTSAPDPATVPSGTDKESAGTPGATTDPTATTPAAGQSQGKHAKPEAPETSGGLTTDRASRDADRPTDTTAPGDDQKTGKSDVAADGTYVVVPGDTLCDIAADHHLQGGWKALYGANDQIVGDNPDLILPGQHLDLGY